MKPRTYSRITSVSLTIGILSAMLFDRFAGSRVIAGGVAVMAAVVAIATYFWHHDLLRSPPSSRKAKSRRDLKQIPISIGVPKEDVEVRVSYALRNKFLHGYPPHLALARKLRAMLSGFYAHETANVEIIYYLALSPHIAVGMFNALSEARLQECSEVALRPDGQMSIRARPHTKRLRERLISMEADRAFGIVPSEWWRTVSDLQNASHEVTGKGV